MEKPIELFFVRVFRNKNALSHIALTNYVALSVVYQILPDYQSFSRYLLMRWGVLHNQD